MNTPERLQLLNDLTWKRFPVTSDGFVCLVDVMGNDSSVCQAARVSYDNDQRFCVVCDGSGLTTTPADFDEQAVECSVCDGSGVVNGSTPTKDRDLIRYLMRNRHTTPFEMVELKFLVRVPMDCWRQWIRHRMANVNEYSTRYTEAIDSRQTTPADEWRLQATNNKQGSAGNLGGWDDWTKEELDVARKSGSIPELVTIMSSTPGAWLTYREKNFHEHAAVVYQERLALGVAKEQARKDLPLSTYTEAYWKCDLHNLLHFLGLRMDAHAQKEIRDYAKTIGEQIVKPLFPLVWEAFTDYRLNGMVLSGPEIEALSAYISYNTPHKTDARDKIHATVDASQRLGKREKDDLKKKLERLGF